MDDPEFHSKLRVLLEHHKRKSCGGFKISLTREHARSALGLMIMKEDHWFSGADECAQFFDR
jgi:hypothetical protein